MYPLSSDEDSAPLSRPLSAGKGKRMSLYPEQADEMNPEDHPAHNMPTATQHYAGTTLPLEPQGTLSRQGQDVYRRETARDSVTGRIRTQDEAKGLDTTRVLRLPGTAPWNQR